MSRGVTRPCTRCGTLHGRIVDQCIDCEIVVPVMRAQEIQRCDEMAALFRNGMTLEKIGQMYGLTRERIRQLIKRVGVTGKNGGQAIVSAKKRADRAAKLNERSMRIRGMSFDEYRSLPRSASRKYSQQMRNAQTRGIDWHFNLASWWKVWSESGKWEQRGRGHGYVMARKGDSGPYSPDNVYICQGAQNSADSYLFTPFHTRNLRKQGKHVAVLGCSLAEACRAREIGYTTVLQRIKSGMDIHEALAKPARGTTCHEPLHEVYEAAA